MLIPHFGENLSEGMPRAKENSDSGQAARAFLMVITGPSLVSFFLESGLLLAHGVSLLGDDYSVTNYAKKKSPFQGAK